MDDMYETCHQATRRVGSHVWHSHSVFAGKVEHIDLTMPVGHSLQGCLVHDKNLKQIVPVQDMLANIVHGKASLGKMVCSKTGAMMGIGVHGVAIIRALCGDEPIVVNATEACQKLM